MVSKAARNVRQTVYSHPSTKLSLVQVATVLYGRVPKLKLNLLYLSKERMRSTLERLLSPLKGCDQLTDPYIRSISGLT